MAATVFARQCGGGTGRGVGPVGRAARAEARLCGGRAGGGLGVIGRV